MKQIIKINILHWLLFFNLSLILSFKPLGLCSFVTGGGNIVFLNVELLLWETLYRSGMAISYIGKVHSMVLTRVLLFEVWVHGIQKTGPIVPNSCPGCRVWWGGRVRPWATDLDLYFLHLFSVGAKTPTWNKVKRAVIYYDEYWSIAKAHEIFNPHLNFKHNICNMYIYKQRTHNTCIFFLTFYDLGAKSRCNIKS